ncbi:unnamed protein product [Porites evermanni]|uniref:Apolipoprotein L3 n=1 Tax=Porites evermanni TaxID=104178 RepID=A0ABN8PNR9_9CNID|nr:unnamed protein product [Porites evermanni]
MLENHESFIVDHITAQFDQLRKLREELHDAFLRWIPMRKRTKEQFEELAIKVHEHHRNMNISTITGASMGTIGGILSVAGLIAAPFTFGAGIVVSLVGAGIGGAGGLVMSGSKVLEIILEKLGLKEVQAAIEDDREACSELQEQLDSLENFISSLAEFLKPLHDDAVLLRELEGSGFEFLSQRISYEEIGTSTEEIVEFGARFFRAATSAATISASAAGTAGAVARSAAIAGTRAADVAGSVISAALLPLDITLLVKSSLELHRGSTSAAVQDIRRILDELECPDRAEIEGLVESFIDEKFTEAYNKMDHDKEQEQNRDSDDSNEQDKQNDDVDKRQGTEKEILLPSDS